MLATISLVATLLQQLLIFAITGFIFRDYLDNLSRPTTYFLYKKSGTLRFLLS